MVRTSSGLIMQSGSAGEGAAEGVVADTTSEGAARCPQASAQPDAHSRPRTSAQTATRLPPWSFRRGLRVMPADTIISGLLIIGSLGDCSACFLRQDIRGQNPTSVTQGRGLKV